MIIGRDIHNSAQCAKSVHTVLPVWRAVLLLLLLAAAGCDTDQNSDTVTIAIAANFLSTAQELVAIFETSNSSRAKLVSASTGALYAQIVNGAPFDVLLAADQNSPQQLESAGYALAGSRFVYAVGALSFCSADNEHIMRDDFAVLSNNFDGRLAIANPAVAPYGQAAEQVLATLSLPADFPKRIVKGESVIQAYTFVATGSVDYGFVARASVVGDHARNPASCWDVPAGLHTPLRQDAVLLSRAAGNPAAAAFIAFLKSSAAQAVIVRHGYGVER